MLISELTFPHLREAQEARLVQQLERRRIALERRAERAPRRTSARVEARSDSSERMSRASAGANEAGRAAARPV